MKQSDVQIINKARDFGIHELFFSTTDSKGCLTAWNTVFSRVAGYSPEQLKGRPHNVVRHPDMPRCVFQLLWDYLLSGKAIGAYVKNRASTGEYYWVFALANPIPDGFLSIRLKPTSPFLEKVEGLYGELLKQESGFGRDWRAGIQASTQTLLSALKSLGFEDYDHFMSEALRVELDCRSEAMGQQKSGTTSATDVGRDNSTSQLEQVFSSLENLSNLRKALGIQETVLIELDVHLGRVAINSGVRAAHLGDAGLALGVIGEEISKVAKAVSTEVSVLKTELSILATALKSASFNVALARLQAEMSLDFTAHRGTASLSISEQLSNFGAKTEELSTLLAHCSSHSLKEAMEGMNKLIGILTRFDNFLDSLNKILLTVQFAYVTGKTQAARIEGGDTFARLLTDLRDISDGARGSLAGLSFQVERTRKEITACTVSN